MKFLNKINKVSLLIGVSTLLLVGGVYATFSYSSNVVNPVTSESNGNNTIENNFITDEGTITITKNDLAVSVKNKGNNVTTLDKLTGEVKATFKPSDQASEDTKNKGIFWRININFENNTFSGKNILETHTHGEEERLINGKNETIKWDYTWLHEKRQNKEITLTSKDLNGLISVNEFNLSTFSEYDTYTAALKNVKIAVTLGRYVPSLTPTK